VEVEGILLESYVSGEGNNKYSTVFFLDWTILAIVFTLYHEVAFIKLIPQHDAFSRLLRRHQTDAKCNNIGSLDLKMRSSVIIFFWVYCAFPPQCESDRITVAVAVKDLVELLYLVSSSCSS
jgi:hypothetical protein